MSLGQKVETDLKAAMKSRDELTTSCLRLVRAALKSREKDLRRPLSGAEEIAVFQTLAKQRRDSAEQFLAGGRPELAEREKAELVIIQEFLPSQMDESQLRLAVAQIIAEVGPAGPQDLGKVMKEAMARLAGKADGKLVNQLVREQLTQS
ncbi:MAG: GatB/YqeY domain-containing protein [Deltaproteobacteria bacterium]|nr:GatB/YqeY domain-containing protein [Deltaproteobacteria bacterium]